MGRTRHGSIPRRQTVWIVLFAAPLIAIPLSLKAGIAPVPAADPSNVSQPLPRPIGELPAAPEMVLPDPGAPEAALVNNPSPQITIPQLSSDVTVTSAPLKDNPNAIPLPPAVQSGLTGLAALGLAGGLRRLRRAFR